MDWKLTSNLGKADANHKIFATWKKRKREKRHALTHYIAIPRWKIYTLDRNSNQECFKWPIIVLLSDLFVLSSWDI